MKKRFKRLSGSTKPLSEAEKQTRDRLHQQLPNDVEVLAATRRMRAELEERQLEFSDVVQALRAARENRGLSLQDVCDRTGITKASLSLLENGRGNPTMTTLRRIAKAIGVEILVTVK